MTAVVRRVALTMALLVLAGACDSDPETTSPPTTAFDPVAHARGAVVGVESEGDFGAASVPIGTGTGLAISSDGLIATVATAVAGAERVNVFVPGERYPMEGEVEALAECVGVALVKVDRRFPEPASITGAGRAQWLVVAHQDEVRVLPASDLAHAVPGAVAVDADGEVVGVVRAPDESLLAGSEVAEAVDRMRIREVVHQLGFVGVDAEDGSVLVTNLVPGSAAETTGVRIGDRITALEEAPLTAGFDELCSRIEDGSRLDGSRLELIRDGRRYVGQIGGAPIAVASRRTTEQLRQAVVRVDADRGGDGVVDLRGSGFFVSADGLVVTNHHVVAGLTEVAVTFDGGERSLPGRVIGRSSCSDLALIDVDGEGFTFLEWAPASPTLEQPVRSIGFPRGTNRLTIQSGTVSKEEIDPFVDSPALPEFEHSAQIIGGSSGGPVVNEDGEVVGVTHAGLHVGAAAENFAIAGPEAQQVVGALQKGDHDHIGAVLAWDLGPVVDAVDPGTVAAEAGLRPHDRILRVGSLSLGELTIRGICEEVLGGEGSPVQVEVYRPSDGREHEGELFGRPLEPVPDPFFVWSPGDVIGTVVPGRWISYEPIEPEGGNDWVGFRAGVEGFDWQEQFGRDPFGLVLVSLQRAGEGGTTETELARDSYEICRRQGITPVTHGPWLIGHTERWRDCATGLEIWNYAFLDTSQDPAPMVVMFILAHPDQIAEIAGMMLENLVVEAFPEPPG